MDPRLVKAAQHWSKPEAGPPRTRWWQSKAICRHINQRMCGVGVDGTDGGDIELIRQLSGAKQGIRAVSVGCGSAFHELRLLEAGVVETFVLYELSETRAAEASARARSLGLSERVSVRVVDAFAARPEPEFGLVYWKDALHHMFDARAAVEWSQRVLERDGIFFMNEFVGPTHMQYTDRQLDLAEKARRALPARYLANPHAPAAQVPLRRARPSLEKMLEIDPTECADSANILPAVRSVFSQPTIIPTGGVVYMLALNDILANLDETEDAALLSAMMLADDLCIEAGETLYSVAFAHNRLPP